MTGGPELEFEFGEPPAEFTCALPPQPESPPTAKPTTKRDRALIRNIDHLFRAASRQHDFSPVFQGGV